MVPKYTVKNIARKFYLYMIDYSYSKPTNLSIWEEGRGQDRKVFLKFVIKKNFSNVFLTMCNNKNCVINSITQCNYYNCNLKYFEVL